MIVTRRETVMVQNERSPANGRGLSLSSVVSPLIAPAIMALLAVIFATYVSSQNSVSIGTYERDLGEIRGDIKVLRKEQEEIRKILQRIEDSVIWMSTKSDGTRERGNDNAR